jgi:menaquinone-dependent protoporphyrinogen IX oxidase
MAGYISDDTRKVTTHRLIEMKERGEKISMLTAYDITSQVSRNSYNRVVVRISVFNETMHSVYTTSPKEGVDAPSIETNFPKK